MNFPDLLHLKQCQADLWQWPRSRAAVMVGAGFSRNAEPLPGTKQCFPTWQDLAIAMVADLYPLDTPEQRQVRRSSRHPMRIASEYEAAFDKGRLDRLVRSTIPDAYYIPGKLHQLLMDLPWADVFTTNYDTLLERTRVDARAYSTVTKASELSTAFAPRIVKLHGSFPSQTPFILSEEDYRTYPWEFAPFVNCVRESLLENTFILVGFSGDDPNFLEWTGWIRDELGGHHAPIYLVGAFSFGNAERLLLERRGIKLIDLSPLVPATSTGDRQAHALEQFFIALHDARPSRPGEWPNSRKPRLQVNILAPGESTPPDVPLAPMDGLADTVVVSAIERWRFEREHYPGWLVAPEDKRASLWTRTRYWILPLAEATQNWPAIDRLLAFREINWRLDMIMAPAFSELAGPFETTLLELLSRVKDRESSFVSAILQWPTLTLYSVTTAWLEIAFGLLRDARENYNATKWEEWKAIIDEVILGHSEALDRMQYEIALWNLWNVNRTETRLILATWQPAARSPLVSMRKAALLAEVDELGEARTLLRSALQDIRAALQRQGQNIEMLSLEGWCTYVLGKVDLSLGRSAQSVCGQTDPWNEFSERWEELRAWDCDPWPRRRYFDEILLRDPPEAYRAEREVRGFDPGEVSITVHLGGDDVTPYLPAFACIRLYEQAGIPMRITGVAESESLKHACRWIAPFFGFWSPALLIRAARSKDLIESQDLGRIHVASMDSILANRICEWCLDILARELSPGVRDVNFGSALESIIDVVSEVLSRLSFKGDPEILRRSFTAALSLHRHAGVRANLNLRTTSAKWFKRLFLAADDKLLVEWLPELITDSLTAESWRTGMAGGWRDVDPMVQIVTRWKVKKDALPCEHISIIRQATDWLLQQAELASGEVRDRARIRLTYLYYLSLMTTEQDDRYCTLLWSDVAPGGLPKLPAFSVWGYLRLPAPTGVDVPSILKNCLLRLSTSEDLHREEPSGKTVALGGAQSLLIYECAMASKPVILLDGESVGKVEWTEEEAKSLCLRVRGQWKATRATLEVLKGTALSLIGGREGSWDDLGSFLARVVLPRMGWAGDEEWKILFEWMADARSLGVFPSEALPYMLLCRPTELIVITRQLADDLNGGGDDTICISAAAKAVRHWIGLAAKELVPPPPASLLTSLVERVAFRRRPAIIACLYYVSCIVLEAPNCIGQEHAALLSSSLVPWHHATRLPPPKAGSGEFLEAELPDVRVAVGHLAAALRRWYARVHPGMVEPEGISKWQEWCATDALPEIRSAFDCWRPFRYARQ